MERTKRVKRVKENSEGPIERRIVIGLITNDNYTREVLKIGDLVQLLESLTAKMLAGWCIEYFKKYDKSPNKDIEGIYFDKLKSKKIRKELADEISEDILPSLSAEYEKSVNPFLLDETVKHFKFRQAQILKEQLEAALQNGDIESFYSLQATFKPIQKQSQNKRINAWDMYSKEIKPVDWLVEDLLPKGLTVFAGRSKLGKSFLMLNMALNLAQDKYMFSDESATGFRGRKGPILYLSLEDPEARIQSRIRDIEQDPDQQLLTNNLEFQYECQKLFNGGLTDIEEWIKSKRHPKLVVIDCIARIWNMKSGTSGGRQYVEDYSIFGPLSDLAHKYHTSIIAITHTRKAVKEADVFMEILGGSGTQGPADNLMVLTETTDGRRKLSVRGKDTAEKHLLFEVMDEGCNWYCLGDSNEVMKTTERQSIYNMLSNAGTLSYQEIKQAAHDGEIKVSQASINTILRKMVKDGELEQDKRRGKYSVAGYRSQIIDMGIGDKLNRQKRPNKTV